MRTYSARPHSIPPAFLRPLGQVLVQWSTVLATANLCRRSTRTFPDDAPSRLFEADSANSATSGYASPHELALLIGCEPLFRRVESPRIQSRPHYQWCCADSRHRRQSVSPDSEVLLERSGFIMKRLHWQLLVKFSPTFEPYGDESIVDATSAFSRRATRVLSTATFGTFSGLGQQLSMIRALRGIVHGKSG